MAIKTYTKHNEQNVEDKQDIGQLTTNDNDNKSNRSTHFERSVILLVKMLKTGFTRKQLREATLALHSAMVHKHSVIRSAWLVPIKVALLIIVRMQSQNSLVTRTSVLGVCEQARLKQICSATEDR